MQQVARRSGRGPRDGRPFASRSVLESSCGRPTCFAAWRRGSSRPARGSPASAHEAGPFPTREFRSRSCGGSKSRECGHLAWTVQTRRRTMRRSAQRAEGRPGDGRSGRPDAQCQPSGALGSSATRSSSTSPMDPPRRRAPGVNPPRTSTLWPGGSTRPAGPLDMIASCSTSARRIRIGFRFTDEVHRPKHWSFERMTRSNKAETTRSLALRTGSTPRTLQPHCRTDEGSAVGRPSTYTPPSRSSFRIRDDGGASSCGELSSYRLYAARAGSR